MNMGERIKQLRIANGLTQEELGKYIGVQKSAIRKYEKGEVQNIKRNSIQILSNLFGVSPSYLMCIEDEETKTNNYTTTIPLLSNYSNSLTESIDNFFIKNININYNLPAASFALQITNNSMLPLLGIGDIAIITETFSFESGQTCLISKDNILMIRKVIKANDEYSLEALNPYYPIEKTKNLRIYGKVLCAENKSAFK